VGFALDALTYFVSALALTQIRVAPRARRDVSASRSGAGAYRTLWEDVREGARVLGRSRRAMGAVAATGLLWVAGGALHVAAPILLARRGGGIVAGVGTLLAAVATGMVAVSVALAARGGGASPWRRIALGLAGAGGALVLFAHSRHAATDLALGFGAGGFVALLLVTTEAALQESIGPEARARVFALRDFTARFLVLASAGLAGLLLAQGVVPAEAAVLGAGVFLAAGGIALALLARRSGGAAGGARTG
jgi:hypothetical protein